MLIYTKVQYLLTYAVNMSNDQLDDVMDTDDQSNPSDSASDSDPDPSDPDVSDSDPDPSDPDPSDSDPDPSDPDPNPDSSSPSPSASSYNGEDPERLRDRADDLKGTLDDYEIENHNLEVARRIAYKSDMGEPISEEEQGKLDLVLAQEMVFYDSNKSQSYNINEEYNINRMRISSIQNKVSQKEAKAESIEQANDSSNAPGPSNAFDTSNAPGPSNAFGSLNSSEHSDNELESTSQMEISPDDDSEHSDNELESTSQMEISPDDDSSNASDSSNSPQPSNGPSRPADGLTPTQYVHELESTSPMEIIPDDD